MKLRGQLVAEGVGLVAESTGHYSRPFSSALSDALPGMLVEASDEWWPIYPSTG